MWHPIRSETRTQLLSPGLPDAQSVGGLGLGVVVGTSLAVSSWTAVAGSGSLRLWLGAVLRSWEGLIRVDAVALGPRSFWPV